MSKLTGQLSDYSCDITHGAISLVLKLSSNRLQVFEDFAESAIMSPHAIEAGKKDRIMSLQKTHLRLGCLR